MEETKEKNLEEQKEDKSKKKEDVTETKKELEEKKEAEKIEIKQEEKKQENIEPKKEILEIKQEQKKQKEKIIKEQTSKPELRKNFYDKIHKLIILVPIILLVLSFVYLFSFYQKNGDIINKDISLKGGTSITINIPTDISKLKQFLTGKFAEFEVREISDLTTGKQIAFIVGTTEQPDTAKKVLEEYLGFALDDKNSSIEFTGSTLGEGFYNQLRIAIFISFVLMSLVVFIIYRTFVPSFTVILCAFADIVMTLTVVNLSGMKISAAGIIAFLMLIGYSVDSDILLTTRVLRRRGENVNSVVYSAFKTGMTMTLTSLAAVFVSLLITSSFSDILRQIFTVLTIGLIFDMFNTWVTNASIIKWYAESKLK